LQSHDIFLRLPCREDIYEAQEYVAVPYFRNEINDCEPLEQDNRSALSPMAFLVEIVSLWSDVSHHVFRSPHISAKTYRKIFEDFYETIVKRSEEWITNLPSHFSYSMANMERSIRAGSADAFISIHMLYHVMLMKLNRHARHEHLPADMVERNIRRARHHAIEILRISVALTQFNHEHGQVRPYNESSSPRSIFSTPLATYVILSATDVLSAAGFIADISECISLINGGLDLVEDLCQFWDSARTQLRLMRMRVEAISLALKDQTRLDGKLGFAIEGSALDSRVRLGFLQHEHAGPVNGDLVYGLSRERYINALGLGECSISKENILWIKELESEKGFA